MVGPCLRTSNAMLRRTPLGCIQLFQRQASTKIQTKGGRDGPTAVVFMNMGGPSNQGEVRDFLHRLFSDGDIIPLGRFQRIFANVITRLRTPKIQKQYAAIGGGSPIRKWSELQAQQTCRILDTTSPSSAPHLPYVAFRYAHPLTADVYAQLLKDGFGKRGRAIAFSQYPQYSCGTTGSSINELFRCKEELESPGSHIDWSIIDRWPAHPKFVEAVAQNITVTLATYPVERRKDVTIIFSAHSQPMSAVNKGDAYSSEVSAIVHAVMKHLGFSNAYRLCWQSKVGPQPWLGPQTSKVVESLIHKGDTHLLLVPIAFTSDHIETLYELDEELIGESGHANTIKRAESLNGSPLFIEALADMVKEHLESGEQSSRQFGNRCLDCQKDICKEARKMFTNR
ncbi:ferrochelatase [Aureobasidium sp. EXF-10728]|nr:ferrochelatase [Aureobasidium sp. EXF-10728]